MKIKTCVICIFIAMLASLNCLSGCFLAVSDRQRAKIYSYYSKDDNYVEVYGKIIRNEIGRDNRILWGIVFDEEFMARHEDICKRFANNNPYGTSAKIDKASQEILINNCFYDLLIDYDNENAYYENAPLIEEQVTVITCPKVWWDGWDPPIVAVKVEDKVYLDFETGKVNYLNWIQNDLR